MERQIKTVMPRSNVFDYLQLCCLVVMIRVWGGHLLLIREGDSRFRGNDMQGERSKNELLILIAEPQQSRHKVE